MSWLTDALGGVKKDIGKAASEAIGVTNPSPVAQNFTKNLQHNLGNIGNYFAGDNPGSPHFGGSILGTLGIGGGGGKSGPPPAPVDYWSQSIGGPNSPYVTTNGIDPSKLMQYFAQTQKGFNPNDQNQVLTAIKAAQTAGWLQPAFEANNTGSDALSQQAMFQNTIQPYLQKIAGDEKAGAAQTQSAIQGIQNQYGSAESPDVKALLGTLDSSINQQAGQDVNYAQEAALTAPGITQIIDMLRAQYINSINNPTTSPSGIAPAKLPAPSTLSAVNKALKG